MMCLRPTSTLLTTGGDGRSDLPALASPGFGCGTGCSVCRLPKAEGPPPVAGKRTLRGCW